MGKNIQERHETIILFWGTFKNIKLPISDNFSLILNVPLEEYQLVPVDRFDMKCLKWNFQKSSEKAF